MRSFGPADRGQDQAGAWRSADCRPRAAEASRAVREYLLALDSARRDKESDDDGSSVSGSRRKPPKEVADRSAGGMGGKDRHHPFFAYDANYLIDNRAGIIVDAEGTRANRLRFLLSPPCRKRTTSDHAIQGLSELLIQPVNE